MVEDTTGGTTFPGTRESGTEYETRVRGELMQSKAIIGEKLGKTVDFLCWPGGGVNVVARKLADEVGSARVANMVMIGAAAKYLGIEFSSLIDGIKFIFGKKGEEMVNLNIKALEAGKAFAEKFNK